MTSGLVRRVWQHRNSVVDGFSKRHGTYALVYFEIVDTAESAILREKKLKHWRREWKLALIEKVNPYWRDRFEEIAVG